MIIRWYKNWLIFAGLAVGAVALPATTPVQIVTDVPIGTCTKVTFHKPVRLFKDPNVYLESIEEDYSQLIYTTLKGDVYLLQGWADHQVPLLAYVAHMGHPDARYFNAPAQKTRDAMARPVKICPPSDGYSDALGFILLKEWEDGVKKPDVQMTERPPSTPGNPIYSWNREQGGVTAETTRPF